MAARQNHIEISVIYRILTIRKFKMNKFELQPHRNKRWPDILWKQYGESKYNRKVE